MLLDGSNLGLCDFESKIIRYLADAEEPDSSVHNACYQFGIVLHKVLRCLPGKYPWRYWSLDEFCCDGFRRRDQVVTLQGIPYWLPDIGECDFFRIDVALDKEPLLYSYKFKKSKSGKQILYIGKTLDGWIVNGA